MSTTTTTTAIATTGAVITSATRVSSSSAIRLSESRNARLKKTPRRNARAGTRMRRVSLEKSGTYTYAHTYKRVNKYLTKIAISLRGEYERPPPPPPRRPNAPYKPFSELNFDARLLTTITAYFYRVARARFIQQLLLHRGLCMPRIDACVT